MLNLFLTKKKKQFLTDQLECTLFDDFSLLSSITRLLHSHVMTLPTRFSNGTTKVNGHGQQSHRLICYMMTDDVKKEQEVSTHIENIYPSLVSGCLAYPGLTLCRVLFFFVVD